MQDASSGQWDGLYGLWHIVKRVGVVLMLMAVGVVIGGTTLGLATILCYGIGMYVGIPAGAGLGIWIGLKMPPRDAAISFVSCFGTMEIFHWYTEQQNWEGILGGIGTAIVASLAAWIIPVLLRQIMPDVARHLFAVIASWVFAISQITMLLHALYSTGS